VARRCARYDALHKVASRMGVDTACKVWARRG